MKSFKIRSIWNRFILKNNSFNKFNVVKGFRQISKIRKKNFKKVKTWFCAIHLDIGGVGILK